MAAYRIGLIINPLAGMGGPVALTGTDGELARRAAELGARPMAFERAVAALGVLHDLDVEVLTCSGQMGADACRRAGLPFAIAVEVASSATTSQDTHRAAEVLSRPGVDLLLIVGGDGTARDVLNSAHRSVPILGVPAGVKMHSAIFAATARTAGDVARMFLRAADRSALLQDAEIMDREIAVPGDDRGSPVLYGAVRTPKVSFLVPHAKSAGVPSDAVALDGAVRRVAQLALDDRISLLGPGTTLQRVKQQLGCAGSVLGVTVVSNGQCLAQDASERRILELITGRPSRIIVGVVGGQGFLFGRGNQQVSSRVITSVGVENIVIVASLEKLLALDAAALLVDTADEELDASLAGFRPVIVSANRTLMFPIKDARSEARSLAAGEGG
jgi:predicted polyphosphate/ATP-dependent NAD kinase